jgi:hypothetical protein
LWKRRENMELRHQPSMWKTLASVPGRTKKEKKKWKPQPQTWGRGLFFIYLFCGTGT